MAKPAMGYLDVVAAAADVSPAPVTPIRSREYALIRAAAANNWIDKALPRC